MVNSLVNLNVAGAARADTSTEDAAHMLFAVNTTPVPTAFLVTYVGGLVAAGILMGTALWRAHGARRWLAVLFPVCLVIASTAPSGPSGALLSVPFAIVMVMLALQIWQDPDAPRNGHQSST